MIMSRLLVSCTIPRRDFLINICYETKHFVYYGTRIRATKNFDKKEEEIINTFNRQRMNKENEFLYQNFSTVCTYFASHLRSDVGCCR